MKNNIDTKKIISILKNMNTTLNDYEMFNIIAQKCTFSELDSYERNVVFQLIKTKKTDEHFLESLDL